MPTIAEPTTEGRVLEVRLLQPSAFEARFAGAGSAFVSHAPARYEVVTEYRKRVGGQWQHHIYRMRGPVYGSLLRPGAQVFFTPDGCMVKKEQVRMG